MDPSALELATSDRTVHCEPWIQLVHTLEPQLGDTMEKRLNVRRAARALAMVFRKPRTCFGAPLCVQSLLSNEGICSLTACVQMSCANPHNLACVRLTFAHSPLAMYEMSKRWLVIAISHPRG